MGLEIPIYERSKKHGYVYWTKSQDFDVKTHLKDIRSASISFNGTSLGKKNIDWKNRRISLGWAQTRNLAKNDSVFSMSFTKDKELVIKTK